MIAAGRTSLAAAIAMAALLLAAGLEPVFILVALAADGLILAAILIQGRALSRQPVSISREGWDLLAMNRQERLVYRVENRGSKWLIVAIRQPLPPAIKAVEGDTAAVEVGPGEAVTVALEVIGAVRGPVEVDPAVVDIKSAGVEWAAWRVPLRGKQTITVFPDTKPLAEYDVLRRHRALGRFGVHRIRQVGAGWEFEQLREYSRDDEYRNINWKATARRRKPITNVFQAEKSQNILICVECGRMMGAPVGDGTALDKAVDAAIMLAHVANRNADRVGLVVFKDTVDLYLKPKRGAAATNHIVDGLVRLAPEGVFPSYAALVDALRVKNKTRSMIFLFTDVNDPQLAAGLCQALPSLGRAHVVVVVSLKDPTLARLAGGGAEDMKGVYRALAARKLLEEREGGILDLSKRGVHTLEADADNLSLAVINRYLEIKKRQLL